MLGLLIISIAVVALILLFIILMFNRVLKINKKMAFFLLFIFLGGSAYFIDYFLDGRSGEPDNDSISSAACKGVSVIAGKEYIVSVCALGYADPYKLVRLRIYSKTKELLAERFYQDFAGDQGADYFYEPEKNALVYYDDGNERYISIPPTRLDWIRARLP